VLTRYMDRRTDGWMDGQGDSYIPSQTLFAGGIITLFMNGKLQYEINLINHV
jgi:hypothetical protein